MFTDKSYTSRDINAITEDILNYIKASTDKWTDFSESDIGMIFVQVLAGVSDMMHFYLDTQALESFVMTAEQPKNIRAGLATINYQVENIGTSQGSVMVKVNPVDQSLEREEGEIVFPLNTRFGLSTNSALEYVSTKELKLQGRESLIEIPVRQGILHQMAVKTSALKTTYKFYLSSKDKIPLDSISLMSAGSFWERVPDAFLEIRGGRKFSSHCDADGYTYILFTHDYRNFLPSNDSEEVSITYLYSEGSKGNIPKGSIDILKDDVYLNSISLKERVSITNREDTYGGWDTPIMDLEIAKARNLAKTMDRCILLEDYEAHALKFTYLIQAKAVDWKEQNPLVFQPNLIKLYVVSSSGLPVSSFSLEEVKASLDKRATAGNVVQVYNADYINTNIDISITVKGSGDFREVLRAEVVKYLVERFSIYKMSLGQSLTNVRIEKEVYTLSEFITGVYVNTPTSFPSLGINQIHSIQEIKVSLLGDDKGNLVEERG